MTHLASALFFIAVLLGAAVTMHMVVRQNMREILLALRGELGLEIRVPAVPDRPETAPARIRSAAS